MNVVDKLSSKSSRDKSILDTIFLSSLNDSKPISAVLHFAGLKSVSDSVLNPITYWENNVSGTINLCKVMEKYNCKNILFAFFF